jgi:osmotically-inducible protein OsmY
MVAFAENRSVTIDPHLVTQVSQALRDYDSIGFARVHVHSQLGVVTLSGSVGNWYARSLAYQLARRQPQVAKVVDALRVHAPPQLAAAR